MKKQTKSKSKKKQENIFLIYRTTKEFRDRVESHAKKSDIPIAQVVHYLLEGWMTGKITIEINVKYKQSK